MLAVATFNMLVLLSFNLQNPFENGFAAFPGMRWRIAIAEEFESSIRLNLQETGQRLEIAVAKQQAHPRNDEQDEDQDDEDDLDLLGDLDEMEFMDIF